ncbi:hypothetical protein DFP72DRAFT_824224 [Ephemerocybe angulata]|uniref:F-box domain-containing protein n=1 Tax=Ephemerocybe angulata TaxID=980116 RepID=A0A8H6LXC3_9AGAR|nr:hypothetical protein DFP72DRAFT_824224 [Tulosesus angulatus]
MLHALPYELLDLICSFLTNHSDLHAAATACAFLHNVAIHILYKTISVRKHNLPMTTTLVSKPHLAQIVQDFKISAASDVAVPQSYFTSTLGLAISNMSSLVSLSLSLPSNQSCIALQTRLDATFPHLTRLQATIKSLDSHFFDFIGKAPNLASLVLDQVTQAPLLPPIPQSLLPKLASFSGSAHLAGTLIPGRPVSSISLTSGLLSETLVAVLAQSSAVVLSLDAVTDSSPLPILGTLRIAMPELVDLRLGTSFDFWDESFNATFLQTMKASLTAHTQLKSANIAGVVWKWNMIHNRRTLTSEPRIFHNELNDNDCEWAWPQTYDSYSY